MTVKTAYQYLVKHLEEIHDTGEAQSIARIVFEDAFQVFNFQKESILSDEKIKRLEEIKTRLATHEPIQYILGEADFYGLKFLVNPLVLIPRAETEELVFWIEETVKEKKTLTSVLDIGTGSGCIPVTLKKHLPSLQVSATDVSRDALKTAASNAEKNKTELKFIEADILQKEVWKLFDTYDIIVSNPPYIPQREKDLMPAQVLENEPHLALFTTDEDPLIFYRTIGLFAQKKLRKNGCLFFECNEFNAPEVASLLLRQGWKNVELRKDMQGKERMIKAER